jgi:3-dehydroquinate synthase
VLVERDLATMAKVIRQSAVLHLRHISTGGDPFEQGSSRPLDSATGRRTKLEQVTNHRLGHGEAVGIGIALDSTYAYLAGFLAESTAPDYSSAWRAWRARVRSSDRGHLSTPEHPDCVMGGLADFQEHLGGRLTIMLLKDIGHPFDVHEVRRNWSFAASRSEVAGSRACASAAKKAS